MAGQVGKNELGTISDNSIRNSRVVQKCSPTASGYLIQANWDLPGFRKIRDDKSFHKLPATINGLICAVAEKAHCFFMCRGKVALQPLSEFQKDAEPDLFTKETNTDSLMV